MKQSPEAGPVAGLDGSPYQSYVYSYPHKSAYRPLQPAHGLRALWARERRTSLFLYLHLPFCEMRCGFCNLFTVVGTRDSPIQAYLRALANQAAAVREALDQPRDRLHFARVAIGGGTPTYLEPDALATLLDIAEVTMGASLTELPVSVETSPATADADRLAVLVERGVDRISIGVQSFSDDEVRAIGRAQERREVIAALERIRASGARTLNIDLMYGLPGQTEDSLIASLAQALAFAPEELFLYPLYVRPLTGMDRSSRARARMRADWDGQRLQLYRLGRDWLRERGYRQVSMRLFRRDDAGSPSGSPCGADAPVYRCQEDGMVGLGAGARSYTDAVHYSTDYAVGSPTLKSIIAAYIDRDGTGHRIVDYGCRLDREDRRLRYILLSLLCWPGLDLSAYERRFGASARADVPALDTLLARDLAVMDDERLALTDAGMERADAIGPWLFSERVRALMAGYELR